MLLTVSPTSNTERQREFRERNPGYYGRWHRRRKAKIEAAIHAHAALHAPALALPAPVQLLLPAPMEQLPLFTFADREAELIPLTRPTTERAAASDPSYAS
jgi:hypothetical protein